MKRGALTFAAIVLLVSMQACGDTPRQFNPLPAALGDLRGVAMGFEGLLPLGPGEGIYAAWVNLENRDVVPLGPFNVDADGRPIRVESGNIIERFSSGENLFNSVSVIVTLEATGTPGGLPSRGLILQGPFIDGVAQLSVPAPLLIGESAGRYRIFTPTDGPDTNETSGAWATDETGSNGTLVLPPLNNVYAYEHYMEINGQTVTMGRFNNPELPDFANPFSGEMTPPAFPGEDFLVNAPAGFTFPLDLSGARLFVTLEPIFDDNVNPSQLVVLEVILPAGLQGGEIVELVNRADLFPTGTAAIF